MQLFEILNSQIFNPLTGRNQQVFFELLMLIWDHCRTSTDYSLTKNELIRLVEEFLEGVEVAGPEQLEIVEESDDPQPRDLHSRAIWYIARLRNCGWLEDLESGYEVDARTALCPRVIPLLQAFEAIIRPKTVTYSGKLYKAYQLLAMLAEEKAPYENILKEVAAAMDELNTSLRSLNASIGTYIDQMTQHKTPQEVLDLFEKYEEEIVVAAYQRFKTSDNLFNYRESLLEGLDLCQDVFLEALAKDYQKVERCEENQAAGAVLRVIDKVRDDISLMGELIGEIDKSHITYRQRAVQRAQFMLLTDGSTQGRINSLLRYYAEICDSSASLFEIDESPLSKMWRLYPVQILGESFLKPAVTSRKPTQIEPLQQVDAVSEEELRRAQEMLLAYARSAVTLENVNAYAKSVLGSQSAARASNLAESAGENFIKVIALHTYSQSENRNYEMELRDQWISVHGIRFQEFIIKRRV